jgi:hypothetical protein
MVPTPGLLRSHRGVIVYDLQLYCIMDLQYDPEREAVAAMKLAAEADGPERQRWITAALAWSELTRLRGAASTPCRTAGVHSNSLPVQGAAPSHPLSSR